jgi:poly(A) polymerase
MRHNHGPARAAAEKIVRTLRQAGHVAYFAGGCVRDEILGLEPSDYDVATDAVPERVVSLFPRAGEVGKSFGVVIVRLGAETVEVATFRSDGPYTDARRPDSVRFSSPEEDAARRDFTVNALFLDPTGEGEVGEAMPGVDGLVIDYVNGRADIIAKVLRAVGDPEQRLAEDHLRALRAARLAAKLGFQIEEATTAAIRAHASELRGISRERIGDEVRRMMLHPSRARGAWLLCDLWLEEPILGSEASLSGSGRCLGELPATAPYPAALAAWALDCNAAADSADIPGVVAAWRDALDLSNDERDGMRAALFHGAVVVGSHAGVWSELSVAARKRAAASPAFRLGLDANRGRWRDRVEAAERDVAALAADGIGLNPAPLVTGEDLIVMGLAPGPRFKSILDQVYDAQLEGRVKNLQEGRELARTIGV